MLGFRGSWAGFSFLILFCLLSPIFSVCYYPNGNIAPSDVACSDTTTESACCSVGYICLSNGICMQSNDSIEAPSSSSYVRGSCTDQTWRSSYCPNFCVNTNAPYNDDTAGGEGMARCPNTTIDMYYCVDSDQSAVNCETRQNVIIFQGTPSAVTTIGVLPSTSSFSMTTSSTSTTALATVSTNTQTGVPSNTSSISSPANTSKPSSTNAVAIGAGVGVSAGVLLLGLIRVLFFRYQRKNRTPDYAGSPTATQLQYKEYYGSPPIGSEGYGQGGISPPGQQSSMGELAGHEGPIPQARHEMPP